MKRPMLLCAALLSCGTPPLAAATDFDGQQPLICAANQSFACDIDADCPATPPEEINVPRFLRVSFEEKVIRSKRPTGEVRTTSIEGLRDADDRLILHGTEEGADGMFGWDMVIGQTTGRMTLALASNEFAVVVFGACTPTELAGKQ
jgi:hypothetical protein